MTPREHDPFVDWDEQDLDALARRLAPRIRRPAVDPDRLYSAQEAATYLRCKPPRIYDLIRAGHLTAERDVTRILIRRRELDRHLGADAHH